VVEEIIYTSAEKGLKQGSRGFCTVISTNGMALNLAERLESMSGYRQAFPLHDPKASLNPVCWSHMTTRLAGRSLHVISRVADAGQDYTGRSNKLAHHLVIDNVASLISGPARMLAEPGVVADRWDGTVRHIPPRELRSAPMPATIPLVAWKALTGDEGWAGSVAEQLLQSPAPVSIIFDPGTDTLTLVREVLDLVPAAQRWNVTFTTYFTRLLAGAECQLRFVLNDTPEATSLRNDARARVIDLTSSLPAATGGTLVAMARQGQLTPQEVAPPQPITAARPRTSTEISTKDTGSEISVPVPKLKPGRSPLKSTDRPHSPPEFGASQGRGNSKGVWIGVAIALMFVIGTGALIFLRPRGGNDPFADLVSKTVPQDQPPTEAEQEAARAREQAEKDSRDQKERERQEQLAADEAAKKKAAEEKLAETKLAAQQQDERIRQEAMDVQAKATLEAAFEKAGPFVAVKTDRKFQDRHEQWLFELPSPSDEGSSADNHRPLPIRLDGKEVELALCSDGADKLFAAFPGKLKLGKCSSEPNCWVATTQNGDETIKLAEYKLIKSELPSGGDGAPDSELRFRWLKESARELGTAEQLRWMPLKIGVGQRVGIFLQRRAFTPENSQLNWNSIAQSQQIEFPKGEELKHLHISGRPEIAFEVTIDQGSVKRQTLTLSMSRDGAGHGQANASGLPRRTTDHICEMYYLLDRPLAFIKEMPSYAPDLVGFGKLEMRIYRTEQGAITFKPQMDIVLHIPSPEFVRDSVGPGTLRALRDVQERPALLEAFDADQTENEIIRLKRDFTAVNEDISSWHKQGWHSLLKREMYDKSPFIDLKSDAITKLRPLIEKYPKEDKDVVDSENKKRNSVHAFIPKMELLGSELRSQIEKVLTMYDKAALKVNDLIGHDKDIVVAWEMFCGISAPEAENGPSIKLIFIESTPAEAGQ